MSKTSKAIPLGTVLGSFGLVLAQAIGNVLLGSADSIVFNYEPLYVAGLVTSTSAGIAITKKWKR